MNAISVTRRSRFLGKKEAGSGLVVTPDEIRQEDVSSPDGGKEKRVVVYWKEDNVKPLILNTTNAQAIAEILGTEETDEWIGKQIELYHDPNVSFGGKKIGGIRVRPVKEIPF
jgi:hypothetical protein